MTDIMHGRPAPRHIMHKLTPEDGDVPIMWDKNNPDEVATAERAFNELTGKGHLAYKAEGKRGERGRQLRRFDPDAERIILVAPHAGG